MRHFVDGSRPNNVINVTSCRQHIITFAGLHSCRYAYYRVGPKGAQQSVANDALPSRLLKFFFFQTRSLQKFYPRPFRDVPISYYYDVRPFRLCCSEDRGCCSARNRIEAIIIIDVPTIVKQFVFVREHYAQSSHHEPDGERPELCEIPFAGGEKVPVGGAAWRRGQRAEVSSPVDTAADEFIKIK